MNVTYEKAALIEYQSQVRIALQSMIRMQDNGVNAYNQCKQKFAKLNSEIEQILMAARNDMEYAENILSSANSEYELALRMQESARDNAEREAAMEKCRQAQLHCSEANKEVLKAQGTYYKAEGKMRLLNEVWERHAPAAERSYRMIEERMHTFGVLQNNSEIEINEYIRIMEQSHTLITDETSISKENSGEVVSLVQPEGLLCNNYGMSASFINQDKVQIRIDGSNQVFSYTQNGMADAYKIAMNSGDKEAMFGIKCIFNGLKKNNATKEYAKWNVEYMPLIQANIRQSVERLFSKYVTNEKLESSLKALCFMNQEELSERYGRGFRTGTLGFNDGASSYIASDIKNFTQDGRVGENQVSGSSNTRINYAFVTAVHENLHMMSANDTLIDRKRGIMVGNDEHSRAMNEAFTEYFTYLSCGGDGPGGGLYPGIYSGYQVLMQEMPIIEKAVGRESMIEAYFCNKPEIMRSLVDSKIGVGSWDDMCLASYELLYLNNVNNAAARLISYLENLKEPTINTLDCADFNTAELMRDVLEQNVNRQILPSENKVEWRGEKGNSSCKIKNDATVIAYDKSIGKNRVYSGEEFNTHIQEKYGQDYVDYSHREPNFEPFEQKILVKDFNEFLANKYLGKSLGFVDCDHPGHVELSSMSTDRQKGTYKDANNMVAKQFGVSLEDVADYLTSKGLTWHECGDGKTMRIVPREINQVFTHTGGIGIEMDKATLREATARITGNRKMVLEKNSVEGVSVDGIQAIEKRHQDNKAIKRVLFS